MLIRQVYNLAKDYFFKSEQKYFAISMLALVIGFELFSVYMTVLFNQWNNQFYTSLQEMNIANFWLAIRKFCWIAFLIISTFLIQQFVSLWLKLEWRNWMVKKYIDNWTNSMAFYGSSVMGFESDNPDQRITVDIQNFIESVIGLGLGFINAITTLFSFTLILWTLSGIEVIYLFGVEVTIYGWLFWVALFYSLAATVIMHFIGRIMYSLLFKQESKEADLRYSLIRMRIFAEPIAVYKANTYEKNGLFDRLAKVIENYKLIIKKRIQIGTFRSFYSQISIIFPILVMSPKYFSGKMNLGELMQVGNAFGSVQGAFSWIVDSYLDIANLKAVVFRLNGFNESIAKWNEAQIQLKEGMTNQESDAISVNDFELMLPNNQLLFKCKVLKFSQGNYLISGKSGSGKSTLFRAISGIWPFVKGNINIPANLKVMFLPQVSYMPVGSMLEAICYPNRSHEVPVKLFTLLKEMSLDILSNRLNEIEEWSRVLSLGEQQKIAFIRTILAEPDVVFLDEATSAMDEESEGLCYEMLKKHLPKTTVISIGHRSTIRKYHDKFLVVKDKVLEAV